MLCEALLPRLTTENTEMYTYLILTPSGRPIAQFDSIDDAREYIHGTAYVIQYVKRTDL